MDSVGRRRSNRVLPMIQSIASSEKQSQRKRRTSSSEDEDTYHRKRTVYRMVDCLVVPKPESFLPTPPVVPSDLELESFFTEPDGVVRNSWRLLMVYHFCQVFGSGFSLPKFKLHDLEADILRTSPQLTVDLIMAACTSLKRPRQFNPITLLNWQHYIQYKEPELLSTSNWSITLLDIRDRIHLLYTVFQWFYEAYEERINELASSDDTEHFRVLSLGIDNEGSTYWYFPTAERLYKELPWENAFGQYAETTPYLLDRHWRIVCTTSIESWKRIMEELSSPSITKDSPDTRRRTKEMPPPPKVTPNDRLRRQLQPIVDAVLAKLEAAERESLRQVYLDSLPRRQSNRIAVKQSEYEEIMRQEEQKRREEEAVRQKEAEEQRKLEEERLKREAEERRIHEIEAKERRRLLREQKRIIDDAERILQTDIDAYRTKQLERLNEQLEKYESRRKELEERKSSLNGTLATAVDEAETAEIRAKLDALEKEEEQLESRATEQWISAEWSRAIAVIGTEAVQSMILESGGLYGSSAVQMLQRLIDNQLTRGSSRASARSAPNRWRKDLQLKTVTFLTELETIGIDMIIKYQLYVLLKTILDIPEADLFSEPVDPISLNIPDYFNIVKRPMDLGTVFRRLMLDEYITLVDFVSDVKLICENCYLYNGLNSAVSDSCRVVEREFIRGLVEKVNPVTSNRLINEETLLQSYVDEQARLEKERKQRERQRQLQEQQRIQNEISEVEKAKRKEQQKHRRAEQDRKRREELRQSQMSETGVGPTDPVPMGSDALKHQVQAPYEVRPFHHQQSRPPTGIPNPMRNVAMMNLHPPGGANQLQFAPWMHPAYYSAPEQIPQHQQHPARTQHPLPQAFVPHLTNFRPQNGNPQLYLSGGATLPPISQMGPTSSRIVHAPQLLDRMQQQTHSAPPAAPAFLQRPMSFERPKLPHFPAPTETLIGSTIPPKAVDSTGRPSFQPTSFQQPAVGGTALNLARPGLLQPQVLPLRSAGHRPDVPTSLSNEPVFPQNRSSQ